jgi:cytochrome b subunit of formate dehydrogenase
MTFARIGTLLCWAALAVKAPAYGQEAAFPQDLPPTETAPGEAEAREAPSVPITGSQIPADQIRCATCHTEPALWDADKLRLLISPETLESDVHWQRGVACSDCHGGDPAVVDYAAAHAGLVPTSQLRQRCAVCHKDQQLGVIKGVHAKAGERDDRGRGLPMDCAKCHGTDAHGILAVEDERSPVFKNNQVSACGACHEEDQATYAETVHGKGLYESGLLPVAVCADCHGSHGIYYAADRRSTLHISNVAATCSTCHTFLEKRLASSVHGSGAGLGAATEEPAVGGKIKRHPSCTDCHQGHHLLRPETAEFRLESQNTCGNCHADLYSRYALSMHGELTRQGYAAAAQCADCHGAHDILPVANPNSKVAPGANRLRTCQKCHEHAVSNFADFDPHADFKDAARYPTLHAIYSWIRFSFNFLFIGYLAHSFLWFVRAMVDRLQHGGHATLVSEEYALPRFSPILKATYTALLAAFIGLTASGLTLRYSDHSWGRWLAAGFGGFRSASVWHHAFAVLAVVAGVTHVARATRHFIQRRQGSSWKLAIFGPDSLVPNSRDLRDIGKMLRWFVGLGPKPGFERWAYWEKLDYWALCAAALLIGVTGLMLWWPNLFCLLLPGFILNAAKMVHSEFAIYIASFLFLIHYFHAHFRPEKFPMDLSVLTGMVSEQHLRKYRPDYIARLEREGRLDKMRQEAPTKRSVLLNILGGTLVFALGFWLLAITLLASLEE